MKEDTAERYPIIEKTITLSPEDCERSQRALTINERVKYSIMDLLIAAQTKLYDREQAVWDEISKRFGYQNHKELWGGGKMIEVSWATRVATLRAKTKAPTTDEATGI